MAGWIRVRTGRRKFQQIITSSQYHTIPLSAVVHPHPTPPPLAASRQQTNDRPPADRQQLYKLRFERQKDGVVVGGWTNRQQQVDTRKIQRGRNGCYLLVCRSAGLLGESSWFTKMPRHQRRSVVFGVCEYFCFQITVIFFLPSCILNDS